MYCSLLEQTGKILSDEEQSALLDGKHSQRSLSSRLETNEISSMMAVANVAEQIRFNSVRSGRSSAWLQAIPSRGPVDMVLSPDEMQAALLHRLGCVPINSPDDLCPMCSDHTQLDVLGHHHITCSTGGFVVRRHNLIRDGLFHLCQIAGLKPEKERGCFSGDRSRPADILIPNWSFGQICRFGHYSCFAANLSKH
jgi:hypothetical protein